MSKPQSRQSNESLVSPMSSPHPNQASFPPSEQQPKSSSSHTLHSRHGSIASSIPSIGGTLNTTGQAWASSKFEVGQNAISTLLQRPIARTGLIPQALPSIGGYRAPSSRDIPPVTLTPIKQVDPAAFQPYLDQVGSLYEAFQRAKEENGDGGSHLFRRNLDARRKESSSSALERGQSGSSARRASTAIRQGSISSVVVSTSESAQPRRQSSGGIHRRPGHVMTPLSTVPKVYFDGDFHLENPRTFDVVSEKSDIIPPVAPALREGSVGSANGTAITPASGGRKALATNAILQEKLSWYLDTVEVHLISSISSASTSFFAALGSLRELHSEASDSVERIKGLRKQLQTLDQDMAMNGLKVVNMRLRRDNLRKLGETVDQMKGIVGDVERCDNLLSKGETEAAIDVLEALEGVMAGADNAGSVRSRNTPKLWDLRGTKALDGVIDRIEVLKIRIGKAFEIQFLEILLGDLRKHVEEVPPSETLERWGAALQRSRGDHVRKALAFPAYMNLDDRLRSKLLATLRGLSRSNHTMTATTAYRDAVLKEIKSLIRRHLPSSNDDDTESMASVSTRGGRELSQQEKSSILARNLRDLSAEDAEKLLSKVYTGLGEILRRLGVQVKVLLDITSGMGSPGVRSPPSTPTMTSSNGRPSALGSSRIQEDINQALDMSSLLGQAVDIAQAQITKILKVRSEQTTRLPLTRFLRYFTINRLFADECEAISGRGGTSLKTIVNGQIKGFVTSLGDSERQLLAQTMDSDLWDATDFGEVETQLLQRVSEASTKDAESWTKIQNVWEMDTSPMANGDGGVTTNGSTTPANSRDKTRCASLDEQEYLLPHSAVTVLRGIESFEILLTNIPSMSHEVSGSILDYLKLFTSRSCQLILGAGATRSAGLKNITTKHLALAYQSLSFIIALIPYIREFVRRRSSLSSSSMLAEYDKLKRIYQEHQQGIFDKFDDIMGSRTSLHLSAMKKIDFEANEAPSDLPHPYMETLIKETITLHRVLSKHLPASTVNMIMIPVFNGFREQVGNAFTNAPIVSAQGKQSLLHDAECFRSRLSRIDGAGEIGDHLIGLVQNRQVAETSASRELEPGILPDELGNSSKAGSEGTNGA